MNLSTQIEVNRTMGFPDSVVFASRMNPNRKGRGSNAKRRARRIVDGMVASMRFGPQFDRLNRFAN